MKKVLGAPAEAASIERARQGYGAAARPLVAAIRGQIETMAYESKLGISLGASEEDVPGPYASLAELLRRLPMVDTAERRRKPREHEHGLWQVFAGIFRFEPEGNDS